MRQLRIAIYLERVYQRVRDSENALGWGGPDTWGRRYTFLRDRRTTTVRYIRSALF